MVSAFIVIIVLIAIFILLYLGYTTGRRIEDREWQLNKLEPIVKQRLKTSRSVIGGQFSEQLAPYLPDFKYNPSEVRFIGKPIDFLVFKGMDEKEIEEVIFVEVKSGKSKSLNKHERILRDVIREKKVRWEQYEVPDEMVEERR
ncbi:MAG: Holliday junction resolvase-like protein [archaeon]|nr:Holliday junction resolvase-like protein [archaeon]